ncbi:permease-like cell division protein FtsX [Thermosediminibacter litoriperuensis]|uniref:Cell division protein FtsX n=1 Tax=Thermosediminibacter litoriperuensis TaxID=291989 RepID=A0A5S5AYD8_9FIRM|nr:permease-like cell division protein FtsX [Thermosediminibacter litoriperuensis]TYP57796.1 cell division transport system permease protein [Thermosediminibacter litoriperuensis]
MKFRTIRYFFKEAFANLLRNGWMSLASVGAVASALIIFGSFLMISINFDHVAKDVESQVEITAYLKDSVNQLEINQIEYQIKSITGVKEVTFISKEQALEEFKKQVGEELLEGIENPLPHSFRIKVESPQEVADVAYRIQGIAGVEEVKYGKGVVEKLFNITYWMRLLGLAIMAIFAVISVFIISNTIRITVFARRREINIMKYIGATDWFVRWPFLIEGMLLGFAGSLIAMTFLIIGYNYLYDTVKLNIPMISLLPIEEFYDYSLGLLAMGTFLGAFGSGFSIKRFLRV